jgi:hypothetical protein
MTKSMTIQYAEADEPLLIGLFKKLKVKTLHPAPTRKVDDDEEGVPLEVALQMVEAYKWIKQVERGEVEDVGTFEDLIAELKADAQEVEMV